MKKLLLILILLCAACTAPDRSRATLQKLGFKDIKLTGYEFWDCSEDDTFHTGFTAVNSQGQRVTGTVCCGLVKNCTVRF
jgi:hypothetical protein